MHDHCHAFDTEAHIKLKAVAPLGPCQDRSEAILAYELTVVSSMSEQEGATKCMTSATDRALVPTQEAASTAGNVTVNVVPTPIVEVTVISPP
jgi:hypothetical protein